MDIQDNVAICRYCETANTAYTNDGELRSTCNKCGASLWTVTDVPEIKSYTEEEFARARQLLKDDPTLYEKYKTYNPTPTYDPNISTLVINSIDEWGNPEENRSELISTGISFLDKALHGILRYGDLWVWMGAQKNRKTTLWLNIIKNIQQYALSKNQEPILCVWDSLESGMTPARVKDTLVSMMATEYLISNVGHTPKRCPVCHAEECRAIGISPEFLRYHNRTSEQQKAIDWAIAQMYNWRIKLYGAATTEGNTRNLEATMKANVNRWWWLREVFGAELFFIDHIQQYSFSTEMTDYEKQYKAVQAVGDFVAQSKASAAMLSQISVGSWKMSQSGDTNPWAAGGFKAQQEANVIGFGEYKPGTGYMKCAITESRRSDSFHFYQPLEDVSGLFYGTPSYTVPGAVETQKAML